MSLKRTEGMLVSLYRTLPDRGVSLPELVTDIFIALAFAWAKWNAACQEALRENIVLGEPSEETMMRVEALEESYNRLVEAKRAHGP
jgi:hypothetical protein